jgi:hypothetical protein
LKLRYYQFLIKLLLVAIVTVLYLSLIVVGTSAQGTATLTAPDDAVFATFVVGDNTGTATAGKVEATGTGWTLTVDDAKIITNGFMTVSGEDNASKSLANPIKVGVTSEAVGTISDYQTALQGLSGYGQSVTFNIPLYFEQNISVGDRHGEYKITLVYTVTPPTG